MTQTPKVRTVAVDRPGMIHYDLSSAYEVHVDGVLRGFIGYSRVKTGLNQGWRCYVHGMNRISSESWSLYRDGFEQVSQNARDRKGALESFLSYLSTHGSKMRTLEQAKAATAAMNESILQEKARSDDRWKVEKKAAEDRDATRAQDLETILEGLASIRNRLAKDLTNSETVAVMQAAEWLRHPNLKR
jgi:hypothetical protein